MLEPTVAENVIVTEPGDHVTFGVLELDGANTDVPYEAASIVLNANASTMWGAYRPTGSFKVALYARKRPYNISHRSSALVRITISSASVISLTISP